MISYTDEKVYKLASYYMCSEICPCPVVGENGFKIQEHYEAMAEKDLNFFERTLESDNDFMQFKFLDQTDKKTFSSFQECFTKINDKSYTIDDVDQSGLIIQEL